MQRPFKTAAVALLLFLIGPVSGPAVGRAAADRQDQWGTIGPWMEESLRRHQQVIMYGIPARYVSAHDPVPASRAKLERGAIVFQQNCVACHGLTGRGNGAIGTQLTPPPANLQWLARMPISRSDPYMYWTIAEGGQEFGSAMPAFKNSLAKSDVWAVIAYVREGPQPTAISARF